MSQRGCRAGLHSEEVPSGLRCSGWATAGVTGARGLLMQPWGLTAFWMRQPRC